MTDLRELDMEPGSPASAAAAVGSVGGLVGAVALLILPPLRALPGEVRWGAFAACLVVAAASFWIRRGLRERILLDFEARQVLFSRELFSRRSARPLASFEDLAAVAVQAFYTSGSRTDPRSASWSYHVVLVTRAGAALRASRPRLREPGYERTCQEARELAERLGAPLHPAQPEKVLKVRPGPELAYGEWFDPRRWAAGFVLGAMAIMAALIGLGAPPLAIQAFVGLCVVLGVVAAGRGSFY